MPNDDQNDQIPTNLSTPEPAPTTQTTQTTQNPNNLNAPTPVFPAVYDLLFADLERLYGRSSPKMYALVNADFIARDNFGLTKYGTRLYPHNGRRAIVDLYQELLDAAVYARQALYEAHPNWPTPAVDSSKKSKYTNDPYVDAYKDILVLIWDVRRLLNSVIAANSSLK